MSAAWSIYALEDPRTDEVRYIGCSRNAAQRLLSHIADTASKDKFAWISGLASAGLAPRCRILESVPDGEHFRAEAAWIAKAKEQGWDLLNISQFRRRATNKPKEIKVNSNLPKVSLGLLLRHHRIFESLEPQALAREINISPEALLAVESDKDCDACTFMRILNWLCSPGIKLT